MASGWFRKKRGQLLFCFYNDRGLERSKTIGPTMPEDKAWLVVGKLGLDKLVGQPDPKVSSKPAVLTEVTFGMLAGKYLAQRSFDKQSTRDLHTQIIRVLVDEWGENEAVSIDAGELLKWFRSLDVSDQTRAKYRMIMSCVYDWAMGVEAGKLIPQMLASVNGGFESSNPCRQINPKKCDGFSQMSAFKPVVMTAEDTLHLLSNLQQPEYEIALLVASCGLRISECLGLKWKDVLFAEGLIQVGQQTMVHNTVQAGGKTKSSESDSAVPQVVLDVLTAWRKETMYAQDDDFIFPSVKLGGKKPRTGSMVVQDYLRPAAVKAGILIKRDGRYFDKRNRQVERFGFHNFRHSLDSFLMKNGANPSVVQGIMRHSEMSMTLFYAHAHADEKRAALDVFAEKIVPRNHAGTSAGTDLIQ